MDRLGSSKGEADFISQMFELDAKNYHVWSYRQWLVRRFELWDEGELEATEKLIEEDVRNNSAWNHRLEANRQRQRTRKWWRERSSECCLDPGLANHD